MSYTLPIDNYLFHTASKVLRTSSWERDDYWNLVPATTQEIDFDCYVDMPKHNEDRSLWTDWDTRDVRLFAKPDEAIEIGMEILLPINNQRYEVKQVDKVLDNWGVHHLEIYLKLSQCTQMSA